MPSTKRKRLKLPSRPPSNGKSPLVSAPAEVRLRIFRHLFQGSRVTILRTNKDTLKVTASSTTRRRSGILLSCRQFRQEAQPVFGARMHLVLETDDFDDLMLPQVFRDIYFPCLKSLELGPYDIDLANFPNLEILYWRSCWANWDLNKYQMDYSASFKSSDIESLGPHVAGDEDSSFVEQWMSTFTELSAAAEAPHHDVGWNIDSYLEAHRMWLKAIRSKERKYRITTKVDFNIDLTSKEPAAWGKTISLVLRLHFDMETHEVLSRHLREISLDDDEWGFKWICDRYTDHRYWPAHGILPDIDINVDPAAYVQKRLEVLTFPESHEYRSDESSSESSESESGED